MIKKAWLLPIVMLLTHAQAFAQCAMCKAVVESNSNSGGGLAQGLNDGILYLMAFPYLLIIGVSIFWYRHKKQQSKSVS